jgi:hypothetical protein
MSYSANFQVFETRLRLPVEHRTKLRGRKWKRNSSPLEDASASQDRADVMEHLQYVKRR